MEKLDIKKIYQNPAEYENKVVKVAGWVKSARGGKAFGFIDLNDGSSFKGVQVVFDADKYFDHDFYKDGDMTADELITIKVDTIFEGTPSELLKFEEVYDDE